MNNILFVDMNKSLVKKLKNKGYNAIQADYFLESSEVKSPVLATASNPFFSFGGGIDAKFLEYYPFLCKLKQMRGGGNERLGNICFTITVNEDYKATKEMVKSAIEFALGTLSSSETLVLSGLGTGIGGLAENDFVDIIDELNR